MSAPDEKFVFDLDHYEFQDAPTGVVMVAVMKGLGDDHTMVGSASGVPLLPAITSEAHFNALVHKLRADGWSSDDYIARQIVDDNYRHTGDDLTFKQHIIEELVRRCP